MWPVHEAVVMPYHHLLRKSRLVRTYLHDMVSRDLDDAVRKVDCFTVVSYSVIRIVHADMSKSERFKLLTVLYTLYLEYETIHYGQGACLGRGSF